MCITKRRTVFADDVEVVNIFIETLSQPYLQTRSETQKYLI